MVQEIFEENSSEMLQGAIIWTPMLATDNLVAANQREITFSDPHVQQFWDPDRTLGQLLSQTLSLKAPIAWDVYLLYPPEPAFWMHQLDEEPALFLDPIRLKHNVLAIIEKYI